MFSVDPRSKEPLYQQIMSQIILFVSTGVLSAGDQLPSIRELASSLGINPNTVARAYSELEQENIIDTIPKKGNFVANISLTTEIKEQAQLDLTELYQKYRRLGLSAKEIELLAKEAFSYAENQESQ